jgi:DNA topoisomerase-1
VAEKCPECGSAYLVEKTLKSGIFLECPNRKKAGEEEAPAPKKAAKKGAKKAPEPVESTAVCGYSKRIGDAPPAPTAETHGPVVEGKPAKKGGKKVLQPA